MLLYLNSSLSHYNPDTNAFDTYYNGDLIGSLPCNFNPFDIFKTEPSDWNLTEESYSAMTTKSLTISDTFKLTGYLATENTKRYGHWRYRKAFNLTNRSSVRSIGNLKSNGTYIDAYISLINKVTGKKITVSSVNTTSGTSVNINSTLDVNSYTGEYYIEIKIR